MLPAVSDTAYPSNDRPLAGAFPRALHTGGAVSRLWNTPGAGRMVNVQRGFSGAQPSLLAQPPFHGWSLFLLLTGESHALGTLQACMAGAGAGEQQ